MADVFISYARAEREDAERIARRLQALGLSVFLDVEGLDGGDVFSEKLDREVKTSGVVLGLWSPLALSRPWVQIECDIGRERGVLVPAAIKQFGKMNVPAPFWNIQFVDLTDLGDEADDPNWRQLMRSIARTLKRDDLMPAKAAGPEAPAAEPRPARAIVSPRPDALPRADAAVFYVLVRTAMNHETIPVPRLLEEARRLLAGREKLDKALLGPAFNRILRVMLSVQGETGERIPPIATLAVDPETHLPPTSIDNAARAFIMDAYKGEDAAERIAELQTDRTRAIARLQTAVFAYKNWAGLLPYVGLSAADPEAYLRGDAGPGAASGAPRPRIGMFAALGIGALVVAGGAGAWFGNPGNWRGLTVNAAPGPSPGAPPDASIVDPNQTGMIPPSPDKGALNPGQGAINPSQTGAAPFDPSKLPVLALPPSPSKGAAPATGGGGSVTLERKFDRSNGAAFGAAFSRDGQRIVTGSADKSVMIRATAGTILSGLNGLTVGSPVRCAVFSPDGTQIATASDDGTGRIWPSKGPATKLIGHGGNVMTIAFSPDGKRILTASQDNTARIWDAASGKEILKLQHSDDVNSAAFSPDGKLVVTASDDRTARVWDAQSGKELMVLSGHSGAVSHAVFSPDGKFVLTASADRTARIWDVATAREVRQLTGHDSYVLDAEYSPDGKLIVTASADGRARLFDAATGKLVSDAMEHGDYVNSAVFSPDGKHILTASSTGDVNLWRVGN